MYKAYAFGLLTAAVGVLLLAVLWLGLQPKQDSGGLLWGATVYETREEFNGYLRSKGLSYKTWLARNPSADPPWEKESFTLGAITVEASQKTLQLVLAGVAWLLATCGTILLLRDRSPGSGSFAGTAAAAFSAVIAVILVAGFWYSTQPKEQAGLLWGGTVYQSKQEFNRYLKSKGLSYETWLARNPGAAPWEPAAARPEAAAARPATEEDPVRGLALPGLALSAVAGGGILLIRGRRRLAAALASPWRRVSAPSLGRPPGAFGASRATAAAAVPARLLGHATLRAGTVAAVSGRRLGHATLRAADAVKGSAPKYGARVGDASRDAARLLLESARERSIGPGHVTLALVVVVGAVCWGMMVVFVFS